MSDCEKLNLAWRGSVQSSAWLSPPLGTRPKTDAVEVPRSEKLFPRTLPTSGVMNPKVRATVTVTVLPVTLPPRAKAQAIADPAGVWQPAVTVYDVPSPAWTWDLPSCSAIVVMPVVSVGLPAAYAAPSRAAFVTSIQLKNIRPASTPMASSRSITGASRANSTIAWPWVRAWV